MSFLRTLRGKNSPKSQTPQSAAPAQPAAPVVYSDPWARTSVTPEEVSELLRCCTTEIKSRGLSSPFLLLPFRPTQEATSGRTFIRQYFSNEVSSLGPLRGERLVRELKLTDVMVLCSIMKWAWARLPGGAISWETFELFKVGETDSEFSRNAFATFIPLSADSKARESIIFDFFDLLAAIAANGKTNGLGGLKLSRLAGWWAFEHTDNGFGFEGGYSSWSRAADATSHLFFAYLRSLSPGGKGSAVSVLPISLQALLNSTDYPPLPSVHLHTPTTRIIMTVETVSPTPFALLRRARNFQFRDDDPALQEFSDYEDPVQALTEECKRVLKCISSANQSTLQSSNVVKNVSGDQSWTRFQDMGFSVLSDSDSEDDVDEDSVFSAAAGGQTFTSRKRHAKKIAQVKPRNNDVARPQTPSWADFMSSGFAEANPETRAPPPMLLSPDKLLPAIETSRGRSSQSNRRDDQLDPGELASCSKMTVDDAFWWVWMTSLAAEESAARKAVFGRCAMIETIIPGCGWVVIEEKVKGSVPEPLDGDVYIAAKKDKKAKRSLMSRRTKSPKVETVPAPVQEVPSAKSINARKRMTISPEQEATVKATAASLRQRHVETQEPEARARPNPTVNRSPEKVISLGGSSVFTLQPVIVNEASPAMKWANNYDKEAIREAYLNGATEYPAHLKPALSERDLPAVPQYAHSDVLLVPTPQPQEPPSPAPPVRQATPPQTNPAETATPVKAAVPSASQFITPQKAAPEGSLTPAFSTNGASPAPSEHGLEQVRNHAPAPQFEEIVRTVTSPTNTVTSEDSPDKLKKVSRLKRLFGGKKDKGASEPPISPERKNGARRPSIVSNKLQKKGDKNLNVRKEEQTPFESFQTARTSPPTTAQQNGTGAVADTIAHEEQPVQTYSNFNQGPLDDQPAFVPDTDDVSAEHTPIQTQHEFQDMLDQDEVSPQEEYHPDVPEEVHNEPNHYSTGLKHQPEPIRAAPAAPVSEQPQRAAPAVPVAVRQPAPVVEPAPAVEDRWAQIRRNAAERAKLQPSSIPGPQTSSNVASRSNMNDAAPVYKQPLPNKPGPQKIQVPSVFQAAAQPTAPSFQTSRHQQQQQEADDHDQHSVDQSVDDAQTDDGEETIESRVARIKARVAELTGNMDNTVKY